MPTAVSRDFLALEGLDGPAITAWLDAAETMVPFAAGDRFLPHPLPLAGRVVANLFFEDSTRTRVSFEIAGKRLGAEITNLSSAGSSASKGETLLDTARNIEAMGVDAIVVRSGVSGAAAMLARHLDCPIVNAGDGRHEHPTQGLLDLLSLRKHLGAIAGRRIAIVGDIANSRVARSVTHGLVALGAEAVLVGPPTLVDPSLERLAKGPGRISVGHDLDAVLPTVDAVMTLRIQLERAAGSGISSDYRSSYGLTAARRDRMRENCAILHPGPVNRGIEIDDDVADDPRRSLILRQVTHGVAVRMAVLRACVLG
jgi:aspartate carbamoyltransferase catalytic subunit